MRVVSLVPSVTETLLAWGVTPVAVTRFCEQPELLAVGGTKDPDVDAIVALAPDLVVVDEEENRLEDARRLRASGLDLHALHITSAGDVAPALAGLAERLGLPGTVPGLAELAGGGSAVACCRAFIPIWRRPWMSINHQTYGSSLLASVGVANVYDGHAERYPTVTLSDALARQPDVVVAPSEPYPFGERHRAELAEVAPVIFVDGKDLFWWGVRTPGARERLGAVFAVAVLR